MRSSRPISTLRPPTATPSQVSWASEASIYGRFGHGVAAEADTLTIRAAGSAISFPEPRDAVDVLAGDEALPALQRLHADVMSRRPGLFSRSPEWWRHRVLTLRPFEKAGLSLRRFALATRDGAPVGYAVYRQRLAFDAGAPAGHVQLDELLAVDTRAEATLWDFITHLDLFPNVACRHAPTDSLLPLLLDDRRRVQRVRVDTLWLHLLDVPRALSGRTYGDDGTLCLRVDGEAFRLEITGGVGACTPGEGAPELTLGRAALGSLYLGAFPASALARAGLIVGAPEALALADRAFASPVAPWCPEIF